MSLFGINYFSVSPRLTFDVYKVPCHQTTISLVIFDQFGWKFLYQCSSRQGLCSLNFIPFHQGVLELSLKNTLNGYISVVYEFDKKGVVSCISKVLYFFAEVRAYYFRDVYVILALIQNSNDTQGSDLILLYIFSIRNLYHFL